MKKYSYIDHIIIKHSKKDYPLPGPGAHFNDAVTMKRIDEENRDLFTTQKKTEKTKSKMG